MVTHLANHRSAIFNQEIDREILLLNNSTISRLTEYDQSLHGDNNTSFLSMAANHRCFSGFVLAGVHDCS